MKVACFYSYEESCILVGQVENQSLVILNQESFRNVPLQGFVKFLESYESEIWTNSHSCLYGYKNVDLSVSENNSRFLSELSDLFLSVKNDIKKEASCVFKTEASQNALKILTYSFKDELLRFTHYVPGLTMTKIRVPFRGGYRSVPTHGYAFWENPDNWERYNGIPATKIGMSYRPPAIWNRYRR
ncbi:hypothetical protein NIES4106_62190 (plasmid) [Fischerella sp. NIES-4106]|nr:hypothetical protein NIES4106_62190 [Fischerella sp. NIES-4106]